MTFNPPTFLPPVLAVGQSNSSNGRQQLGSGLVTHRGIIDSNSLRVQGWLNPQSGRGTELGFQSTAAYGYLQVIDRDSQTWLDLQVSARNITLTATSGKVSLPAGTAQQLIGSYRAIAGWNIPATSAWYESVAQVNATTTGGVLRLEACGTVTHSVATAIMYIGLMIDGNPGYADSQTAVQPSLNGQLMPYSIIYYLGGLAAGAHRFSIMLYSPNMGAGLWSGAFQNLYVTEQRA
ncbi:MAG TPA: hypothetical protein VFA35_02140 [Burkholderiaceae bacterium]|nr:hypothetical protein [Burkholderiaceae bacterium]